ncbi:hypothetical protein [Clostridium perfringens]|uniref:hypothetical protein n=1 Tax=Clostridium perfringens TaxID=1502 RepID=UPI0024BCC3C7|nr:hypothetical protein [Clostridium perfringens]MDK0553516.1 hypothetical protein [Clostridium perfringens]MDT7932608.1 hypothetical protein [Clostridium perfringens]MDT7956685.1 hypothetical protein [Clostridium perfringens]
MNIIENFIIGSDLLSIYYSLFLMVENGMFLMNFKEKINKKVVDFIFLTSLITNFLAILFRHFEYSGFILLGFLAIELILSINYKNLKNIIWLIARSCIYILISFFVLLLL